MLQLKSIQLFDQLQFFGTLKVGQNDREIPNLEFESHCFLENQVFLPAEQAGTNICGMIYQGINFKICLSLFSSKENIVQAGHCATFPFGHCPDWVRGGAVHRMKDSKR